MRIILISDLHINKDFNESHQKKDIIESMCEYIHRYFLKKEEIVFFVLGDVIDGGESDSYKNASILFNNILEKLRGWEVSFEFIPGNHDLCKGSLEDFDSFISRYQKTKHQFVKSLTFSTVYGNMNFIFTSSMVHGEYENGQIDYESVKSNIKSDMANVLVLHHSLLNENVSDHSSVSDSINILSRLSEYKIEFVLHGHTHSCRSKPLCPINLIGTGSLLAHMDENDNNQFNIIQIQAGKINQVVTFSYRAGLKEFDSKQIFPYIENYADPLKITKIKYEAVENYINRKVLPYSLAISDSLTLYLDKDKRVSMLEAFAENKLILLLSDAAAGKTAELNQTAYLLSEESAPYYPVRINLNIYIDQEINACLPVEYRTLNPDLLFLIIDGYDEIERQYMNGFRRRLAKYVEDNPDVNILISSRRNFCRTDSPDKVTETFPKFKGYCLCPLEDTDVRQYVQKRGVIYERFLAEIKNNALVDLQYNPFYLLYLTDRYKEKGYLSMKSDLMNELIAYSFTFDNNQYSDTLEYPLIDRKIDLFKNLTRIALSLQLLQRNYMNEEEYQELFDCSMRELVNYSGVWGKVSESWMFVHNNFQEYLAAICLSKLNFKEVINYITYFKDKIRVKPEWINTLSFLITIYTDNTLLEWLIANSPNTLINFEDDRISKKMKIEILKNIFSEYKEKNIWYGGDEQSLAKFSASNEVIDYLLEEVEHPVHFRAQYFALKLLLNFDSYFDRIDDVKRIIISCCIDSQTRAQECRIVIEILGHKEICSIEITKKLMKLFGETEDPNIRLGMYDYLIQTNNQDGYVNYFLSGITINGLRQVVYGSEMIMIGTALKKLSTTDAIKEALIWLAKGDCSYHLYDEDDIFYSLCQKAEDLSLGTDLSMFTTMLQLFCITSHSCNAKYTNIIISFFENTGTKIDAFENILNQELNNKMYVLDNFIKDDQLIMSHFAMLYKNDELSDCALFVEFVQGMSKSTPGFREFASLIREKQGIEISQSVIINYEELRREGEQNYFNCLFDEVKLEDLLADLLIMYEKPDITCEELKDTYIERSERRKDIELLKWDIVHYGLKNKQVADFFTNVPWKSFSIRHIYIMLSSDSYTLSISEHQKRLINELFNKLSEKVNFNTAATFENDSLCSVCWDALYLICFLFRFDFPCSESIMLDMLMIPTNMFCRKNSEIKIFSFITTHVSKDKINERVKHNIKNIELMGKVFYEHVEYCSENMLDFAVTIALKACLDPKRTFYNQYVALDYLLKIKGEEYIYSEILKHASNDLFMQIIIKLYSYKSPILEAAIIMKYEATGELSLLKYLILMSSEFGVNQYTKMVVEKNKTPDSEKQIPDATEAIKSIKDIKFLPQLITLTKAMFCIGFRDSDFGGLYGSLIKAFNAIAASVHYDKVKSAIEEMKNKNSEVTECVSFCNRILDDIKIQYLENTDKRLTITEIKGILANLSNL